MQKGRDGQQISTTGVFVERNDRHCVVYRGTRTALIAAGLAGSRHFPEGQRRFSWHFPKSGTNWGIRRRGGDVYCLTKLKDRHGTVDAEIAAFYRSAEDRARRDAKFQRFLDQVRAGAEHRAPRPVAPLTQSVAAVAAAGHAEPSRVAARAAPTSSLETLAVATLVFGLTVYLWTRQA
jgi:hypothetical protein